MSNTWHLQLTLPDEVRVKLTLLAVKQRSNKTAIARQILMEALEDVEIPPELLDDDLSLGDI